MIMLNPESYSLATSVRYMDRGVQIGGVNWGIVFKYLLSRTGDTAQWTAEVADTVGELFSQAFAYIGASEEQIEEIRFAADPLTYYLGDLANDFSSKWHQPTWNEAVVSDPRGLDMWKLMGVQAAAVIAYLMRHVLIGAMKSGGRTTVKGGIVAAKLYDNWTDEAQWDRIEADLRSVMDRTTQFSPGQISNHFGTINDTELVARTLARAIGTDSRALANKASKINA